MVVGYGGGGDMNLAMEKGEVQCRAGTVSAYVGREPTRTWAANGFTRALVQSGTKRYSKLPDVPTIYELMETYKTPDATKAGCESAALLRRSRSAVFWSAGDGCGPAENFARSLYEDHE